MLQSVDENLPDSKRGKTWLQCRVSNKINGPRRATANLFAELVLPATLRLRPSRPSIAEKSFAAVLESLSRWVHKVLSIL